MTDDAQKEQWLSHEKRVCILGFAESYKEAFGLNWDTCELWGLNELYKYIPDSKWTRWFEQHDADTLGMTKRDLSEGEQKRHLEWLKQDHKRPIYMQDAFCDGRFPNATPYPLDKMCEIFGRYFTSTIGYMLAMAIAEDFTAIQLAGIDLVSDHLEYQYQRPQTEYLVGIARGQGRMIVIPKSSALLKAGTLYGYEQPLSERGNILTAVRSHKAKLTELHGQKLAEVNTLEGAIQECDNFENLYRHVERGVQVETY